MLIPSQVDAVVDRGEVDAEMGVLLGERDEIEFWAATSSNEITSLAEIGPASETGQDQERRAMRTERTS